MRGMHLGARTRHGPLDPAPAGRLLDDLDLRAKVQEKLELEWSPEQIAAWLRAEYPERPDWPVCHETIYQALYNSGRSGMCRTLTRKLRALRRRRRRADERRIRFVTESQSIDATPGGGREAQPDWGLGGRFVRGTVE
ncbi:hypothetical protein [Rhodococcus opacus]|uniref:hypothetical protein n=1 Tax=Rhodococcus opacus TaxID=37919 RepID=UPI002474625D|nr:hypothetical protein [Rhodococcus opacus]